MKKISVIIPTYNEEDCITILYDELKKLMDSCVKYEWEILFINDGSKDKTLDLIKNLRAIDSRICYVDLSRNFGKEKAMLAGFDFVTGDCAVVMDADLQHNPSIIKEMLEHWEIGYDDVFAKRKSRAKEGWLRRNLTVNYYRILQKIAKVEILPNVGDFRLLDRKCITALKQVRENDRYSKGLFQWIGYRKKEILFDVTERKSGKSSWSFFSLMHLAVDGITSFSVVPLRISFFIGLAVALFSFISMIYYMFKAILFGDPVQGFPTLIVTILFLGGVQLLSIGIIGEYLGRIFIETKQRPSYLAREYNDEIIK